MSNKKRKKAWEFQDAGASAGKCVAQASFPCVQRNLPPSFGQMQLADLSGPMSISASFKPRRFSWFPASSALSAWRPLLSPRWSPSSGKPLLHRVGGRARLYIALLLSLPVVSRGKSGRPQAPGAAGSLFGLLPAHRWLRVNGLQAPFLWRRWRRLR